MVSYRSIFICILSACINISACSGLAIAVSLLAPVTASATEVNMSPVAPTEPGCFSMSLAVDMESAQPQNVGCQDTESCIQNTAHADRQLLHTLRFLPTIVQTAIHVPLRYATNVHNTKIPTLARAGPLHEMPRVLAMTLLKRE